MRKLMIRRYSNKQKITLTIFFTILVFVPLKICSWIVINHGESFHLGHAVAIFILPVALVLFWLQTLRYLWGKK